MKKLMILMLVLGLATVANANLSNVIGADSSSLGSFELKANPGNATGVGGYWFVMPVTSGKTVTGATASVANTADASSEEGDSLSVITGWAGGGIWGFVGSWGTLNVPAGSVLVDAFTGTEAIEVALYYIDDSFTFATLIDTYSVPEPMTIALLGLGGLFIRRKK